MTASTTATVSRKMTRKERYGGSKQFLALLMGRFDYCLLLDATIILVSKY